MDLARLTPIDIEFLDQADKETSPDLKYPHRLALIRSEILVRYLETKGNEKYTQLKEQFESEKKAAEDAGKEFNIELEDRLKGIPSFACFKQSILIIFHVESDFYEFTINFNSDSFLLTSNQEGNNVELANKQKDNVRELSKFLQTVLTDIVCFSNNVYNIDGININSFLGFRIQCKNKRSS
jgi:hypothetical protein